ncbi:MAG: hypothetical protein GX458_23405 [Phyllobacteriaceae bacterium]|nr:hypothetical protein [Phyllobacteriaceae bacterium]
MTRSSFSRLAKALSAGHFDDPRIAAASLNWWSGVAGNLDEHDHRHVRGWVYDSKRPNVPVSLDILVNGRLVGQVVADDYRDDLAKILRDDGRHGFACVLPTIGDSGSDVDRVVVRVSGRPRCVVGAFDVKAPAIQRALDERLTHIFNHISATHEVSARQLEKLLARTGALGSSLSGSAPTASSLFLTEVSAIAGVGQFRDALDDEVETALFRNRLAHQLSETRYS